MEHKGRSLPDSISPQPEASEADCLGSKILTPALRYAAFYDMPPGGGLGPRYIEDYQIMVFQKGRGTVTLGHETHNVFGGDAVFYRPNVRHHIISSTEAPLRLAGIHFVFDCRDNERLNPFPDFNCTSPYENIASPMPLKPELTSVLTLAADNEVGRFSESLILSSLTDPLGRTMEKQGLLLQLFQAWHDAMRRENTSNTLSPRYRRLIDECQRLLVTNLTHPPTAAELAKHADLAPSTFAALFKKHTGYSVGAFVNYQRLLEARRLLVQGRLSVKEVSAAVGFHDPLYFSRCFARHYGHSPSALRNGNHAPSAKSASFPSS
jgi:AraC-like DNA-binding protein